MKHRLNQLYHKIFHSKKIFTQLVLFTAVVSVVPIVFISSVLFTKISRMATEELINSHYQLVAQYTSNLESKLFQYRDSLKQIAKNTIVVNTLMDETQEHNPYRKGNDVSVEVNKSLNLDSKELRNCMIYSDVDQSKIYGGRVAMMEGASREIWYIYRKSKDKDYFIYSALDGKKNTILSLIQNIEYIDLSNYEKQNLGFLKLDIYMNRLFAPTTDKEQQTYSYDVIALDQENHIVYSSNSKYNDILSETSENELLQNRITYYKDTMAIGDTENIYGLQLIFLFNNSQLSAKKAQMQQTLYPAFAVVILIITLTGLLFTRSFARRVATLINKIKVAETGDFSISEELGGNDEIAILDKQFNQMLMKLDTLIKKNYIQQLEKKESEFRNLQLQINPHFLYNTLETISSIAAVKQAFVICDLCEKLGENFRYSLGKNYGEFVTVTQELSHTQNYVYIQKTRFGDKFEVFYNIDPEVENKPLLRFILQPIVENAIEHGLSKMPGKGTLEISINQQEDKLIIKIEDDGVGMSSDRVEEINQYINDSSRGDQKKQSIGIRNVNQRIKLACGSEYGVTIMSTENHGSCFTISLPLM